MRKLLRTCFIWSCFIAVIAYGVGRVYFRVTDGFCERMIVSTISPDPRWESTPLTSAEHQEISRILVQEFRYLGKGCQSYAFVSEDNQYVLKFFKYKKFRPKPYLHTFSFLPPVNTIYQKKLAQKQKVLDEIFSSWKIAYEQLPQEAGVLYVHLNKSENLHLSLKLRDKMGWLHTMDGDQMEFMIQKRADMLCKTLNHYMENEQESRAQAVIAKLLTMIMGEYARGYGDKDHALMQNTGVVNGEPVHVDVGMFVACDDYKDLEEARQQLYNKTYHFRIWLRKHHPTLADYTDQQVIAVIGEEKFPHMKHQLRVN